MSKARLRWIGLTASVVLFVLALLVLRHALREEHYHDVLRTFQRLPRDRAGLAFLLTLFGYAAMTGYDALGFRYIDRPIRYTRIALASFIGYAFSNNLGHSILTGSTVRFRLYTEAGLPAIEIARVIGFCVLTMWLGLLTTAGVVLLAEPIAIPGVLHLPIASSRSLGAGLLALVVAYLAATALRRVPLRVRAWEIALPGPGLSLAQIAVSSLDWTLAGAVLYLLLPPHLGLSFPAFLAVYLFAQFAGLLSQIPGGLGVFETIVLLLLSPRYPAGAILASLAAYRAIYYLLPLGIAAVLLGGYEGLRRREGARAAARIIGQWASRLVPSLLAATTFLAGAILLLSGATPAIPSRIDRLREFVPLPILELSHFLGSLAGVGLLLLAQGIQRRLDAAYAFSAALLAAGIVFSLLKGVDYEEAIVLALLLAALLPCRRHFYRKASLTQERFTPRWIAAISLAILSSVWLGFFSFKHVDYSSDLWWRFAISEDAPRFLRATVGALAVVLALALARLLRPAPLDPTLPDAAALEKARTVAAASPSASANLALLGDKALLFSDSGSSFIMYGVQGRAWVAMGEPVGSPKEGRELAWRFLELCDRHDGWPVFYEVGRDALPLALDLGLTPLKLGEEARVPLERFSMEGGERRRMRHQHRRLESEGCRFSIAAPEEVSALLPALGRISEAWLTEKNTREKGFSLGAFNPGYLARFPVALVRHGDRIVAFANLWGSAGRQELSPDLMRYAPDAPHGVMEYLLVELMLWGKAEGYRWFNLGMAPLSGLENRALAPLWSRLGAMLYGHGEYFYNFQGLRQYKDKFDPVWEPRYLACPGGFALPRILTAVAALISGGLKGVVGK